MVALSASTSATSGRGGRGVSGGGNEGGRPRSRCLSIATAAPDEPRRPRLNGAGAGTFGGTGVMGEGCIGEVNPTVCSPAVVAVVVVAAA